MTPLRSRPQRGSAATRDCVFSAKRHSGRSTEYGLLLRADKKLAAHSTCASLRKGCKRWFRQRGRGLLPTQPRFANPGATFQRHSGAHLQTLVALQGLTRAPAASLAGLRMGVSERRVAAACSVPRPDLVRSIRSRTVLLTSLPAMRVFAAVAVAARRTCNLGFPFFDDPTTAEIRQHVDNRTLDRAVPR